MGTRTAFECLPRLHYVEAVFRPLELSGRGTVSSAATFSKIPQVVLIMKVNAPKEFTLLKDSERGISLMKPLRNKLLIIVILQLLFLFLIWLWIGLGVLFLLSLLLALIYPIKIQNSLSLIRDCPLAVNSSHPWSEMDGESPAQVMLNTASGWKKVGTSNLSVVPRQLSRELVITVDDQGRKEFGTWVEEKPSKSRLSMHLSLLKEAVALRNMFNGSGDDFEAARKNESQDSGLLERSWLDTTPGQSEIEFGVLVRGRNKSDVDDASEKVDTVDVDS